MTEKLFDSNMMEKEIEEKKRNLKENYREIPVSYTHLTRFTERILPPA